MEKKREVLLTVIMADEYFLLPGDVVHISKREGVYYASTNHLDFGLASNAHGDVIHDEGVLKNEFDAVVTAVNIAARQLEVKAEL